MKKEEQRQLWTRLRYGFYTSGRELLDKGFLNEAFLMLSYAIETSMKALISEFSSSSIQGAYKKVKNSHDLCELYDFLLEHEICPKLKVSKEFLTFVTTNFNRYPTQINQARKRWFKEFGGMAKGINDSLYFDDLMLQLNDIIHEKSKDEATNIALIALRTTDTYKGRAFFHQNKFALSKLQEYISLIGGSPHKEWTEANLGKFKQMSFILAIPIDAIESYRVENFEMSWKK